MFMKLKQKIILLAITPMIAAVIAIALAVLHQASLLSQQQRASVEAAYLSSKEAELRHYVALATHSIAHLYESGRSDPATLNEAKAILREMNYGEDGYFFLYDLEGNNLMHPRQPGLVGRNLWELRDPLGNAPIQLLTARAKEGGGFQRYLWEKPSSGGKLAPKLGYVVMLERWGWMLGTGLYLDDVDAAIAKIDTQISRNIHNTMLWIAGIAIASSLAIALSGLALNISEYRVADAKLKVLAQRVVRSQEEERARLSRDLHDGISQWLVSIKLQIESGLAKLHAGSGQADAARHSFERATGQLNDVLGEVRRISHDLRPALLDDLGLATALEHLAREFAETTLLPMRFEAVGMTEGLTDVSNTVLFRIAQESLTNIGRHAQASSVTLRVIGDRESLRLTIADNGIGFDVAQIAQHPKRGIGLRNMHERLEAVGGKLQLLSSANGTEVIATLPRD
jgi:two-component system NarL family sensor kinase